LPRLHLGGEAVQLGIRGRHSFHNEYCEFRLVYATDANGKARPKRFVATTELPEYWMTLAVHDPEFSRQTVNDVLGFTPSFTDLYGPQGAQPHALTPLQRRIQFATYVAGNLRNPELEQAGVPSNPVGDLNTKNVLFMSRPINGLDDLIYIVAFGARAYAVREGAHAREATLHEIFRSQDVTHLACRNADPGAGQGAYNQLMRSINAATGKFRGAEIAFANPLGMYINAFTSDDFTFNDNSIPASFAVSVRIGTSDVVRTRRQMLSPSSSGRFKSRTIRSGSLSEKDLSISRP
jgi:hypothetical protein